MGIRSRLRQTVQSHRFLSPSGTNDLPTDGGYAGIYNRDGALRNSLDENEPPVLPTTSIKPRLPLGTPPFMPSEKLPYELDTIDEEIGAPPPYSAQPIAGVRPRSVAG